MNSEIIKQFSKLKKHPKFWFYFRKAFFQGFLPVLIGFLTLKELSSSNSHLFYYTSLILFFYVSSKIVLQDFIFSTCSVKVLIKQRVDSEPQEMEILENLESTQKDDETIDNYIIAIKKIFCLHYSKHKMFKYIEKICNVFGMDCPILVPYEIILKMCHTSSINENNSNQLMNKVIKNLFLHRPMNYNEFSAFYNDIYDQDDILLLSRESLPKVELTIQKLQHELFGFVVNEEHHFEV